MKRRGGHSHYTEGNGVSDGDPYWSRRTLVDVKKGLVNQYSRRMFLRKRNEPLNFANVTTNNIVLSSYS